MNCIKSLTSLPDLMIPLLQKTCMHAPSAPESHCALYSSPCARRRSASSLAPPPLLLPPPRHLHPHFDVLCLIYPFRSDKSREMRDICCTHFEDACRCSIMCRAKVSFACSGIGSALLTGGGGKHACQAV